MRWVIPANGGQRGLMVYVHGGSFAFRHSPLVLDIITTIAARADLALVMPQQRLAPEFAYPVPVHDIGACFDALEQTGFTQDKIVLAAEQTGANLILSALQMDQRLRRFKPAAMIFYSPWLDLSLSSWGSMLNRIGVANVHLRELGEIIVRLYLEMGESVISPKDPLVSPIFGALDNLPPTMIHACESDISVDDARKLYLALNPTTPSSHLHLWPRVAHMWERYIPEKCAQSIHLSATFIEEILAE